MKGLIKIEFPVDSVSLRMRNNIQEIFDPVRKIWILLTPEEWVRQHFVQYLLSLKYPSSLIAIEKKIEVGDLSKRCDIVVYSRDMQPFMIVECKQMDVPLSQQVLEQVLRYHITLQTPHLIITNGAFTMGFKKENGHFVPVNEFPEYK